MGKSTLISIILVFLTSFLTGCQTSQSEEVYRETSFLFDTEVFMEAYGLGAEQAVTSAMDVMKEIDLAANFYSDDSEITKLNNAAGKNPVSLSENTFELLKRSLEIADLTSGTFDPTIGPLTQLWHNAKKENTLPLAEDIEGQLPLVNYKKIIIDSKTQTAFLSNKGMSVDLGAITKGFAVDKGMDILKEAGMSAAMVRAGGNVYTIGSKPDGTLWKIGIRDPHQLDKKIGFIEIQNMVVDTAANYEQLFIVDGVSIGHIYDTGTGYPSEEVASSTIISKDPVLADALSTAVFTLGKENGLELIEKIQETEGIIIGNDGSQLMTAGFGKMFEVDR